MATQVQAPNILAVGDLANMPRGQREAYYASLSPDQASQERAAYRAYVKAQNKHYLDACYEKRMLCPPTSGGQTWNYIQGNMVFEAPVSDGAFIKELLITLNLTATLAAGTSAVYAANAAAPYSFFDLLKIELNNEQISVPPVIYKHINKILGYARPFPGDVASGGAAVAAISTALENGVGTTVGANTINLVFRVPLNLANRRSPAGLIPAMSDSTRAKVTLVGASQLLGNDARQNAYSAVSGSGHAVTMSGTVKVEAIVVDGSTYYNDRKLRLFLDEEPTVQVIRDLDLLNLQANTRMRQKISTLLQHAFVLSYIIDATAATKFCAVGNINRLALNRDQVGQNKFFEYGTGTDQSVNDYWEDIRFRFGQDFDEGVIPWIYGPAAGPRATSADIQEGIRILNMTPGGFVNVSHEYQLGSIGALAGVAPRVETYLVSINSQGLQQVRMN